MLRAIDLFIARGVLHVACIRLPLFVWPFAYFWSVAPGALWARARGAPSAQYAKRGEKEVHSQACSFDEVFWR